MTNVTANSYRRPASSRIRPINIRLSTNYVQLCGVFKVIFRTAQPVLLSLSPNAWWTLRLELKIVLLLTQKNPHF